jgi:hypothetical protein
MIGERTRPSRAVFGALAEHLLLWRAVCDRRNSCRHELRDGYNSPRMSRAEKFFDKLTAGQNDANFSFDDLCTLLTKLGYTARKTKGSHIIFQRGPSF